MSFSLEIKKELAEIKNKKPCCRTSLLLGLLADGAVTDDGHIRASVMGEELFELVSKTLQGVTRAHTDVSFETLMGEKMYTVELFDERIAATLKQIERAESGNAIFENSKCTDGNCIKCFLRGAFIAHGTVNEPQKGYHLEMKFKNAARAAFVYRLLADEGIEPKIVNRSGGASIGLYYKNSTSIEDLLTYLGAVRCIFDFINTKIEREIRNSVNRGTNCVAGNIAKSVNAAQKQLNAISLLEENGKLSMLPDELFETAKLRLENQSASLSELALKHDPPISKSGLTHRLAKIIEFAEELNHERKA